MIDNKKLFQLAQLAEASYANLIGENVDLSEALLKDTNDNDMFSDVQAAEFAASWALASHQVNTDSGFSASLFESKESVGSFTLAFRGTENTLDGIIDDVLEADVAGIALKGAAFGQIIDMYNYWQRLITPVVAHYQKADVVITSSLLTEPSPPSDSYFYTYQSNNLNYYVSFIHATSIDFGLGEISPTAKVDVTGHSLGGHLAVAFSRLFPENTADIVAVNGAGFYGDLLDLFFDQLAQHPTDFNKAAETAKVGVESDWRLAA